MDYDGQILFPPFRLDLVNEQLWQGTHTVNLRFNSFAVLRTWLGTPTA